MLFAKGPAKNKVGTKALFGAKATPVKKAPVALKKASAKTVVAKVQKSRVAQSPDVKKVVAKKTKPFVPGKKTTKVTIKLYEGENLRVKLTFSFGNFD